MTTKQPTENVEPKIQHGRVDSLTIYEVKENELAELESGTKTGFLFDLALTFLTIAISFLITVTTTEINSSRIYAVYVILVISCFIASIICGLVWFILKKSISKTIEIIKKRVSSPTETADPNSKG